MKKDYIVELREEKADELMDVHWVGELVRCKDCKHAKLHGIDVECTAHEEIGYDPEPLHPLDWLCADG